MSRTFRKPTHKIKALRGLKAVKDGTPTRNSHRCENHGGCSYCLDNRMHKHMNNYIKVRDQLREVGLS